MATAFGAAIPALGVCSERGVSCNNNNNKSTCGNSAGLLTCGMVRISDPPTHQKGHMNHMALKRVILALKTNVSPKVNGKRMFLFYRWGMC